MTRNWRPGLQAARAARCSHIQAVIERLSKRPVGATIAEVVAATQEQDHVVSSRLGQRVRKGTLFKVRGAPVRYFHAPELAAAYERGRSGLGAADQI